LKEGDTLSQLFYKFALEYAIRRVQLSQEGLKLDGTHQVLVYADDANIFGGIIHTINKNTLAFVFVNNESGLEVYAHVSRSECRTKSRYTD
jgi:hypothetical protein